MGVGCGAFGFEGFYHGFAVGLEGGWVKDFFFGRCFLFGRVSVLFGDLGGEVVFVEGCCCWEGCVFFVAGVRMILMYIIGQGIKIMICIKCEVHDIIGAKRYTYNEICNITC